MIGTNGQKLEFVELNASDLADNVLEKLYYMSMDTIGFQMIFLRANTEGEALYRKNRFVDCEEYLDTYDEKAEGCKPLAITLSNLEDVIFT